MTSPPAVATLAPISFLEPSALPKSVASIQVFAFAGSSLHTRAPPVRCARPGAPNANTPSFNARCFGAAPTISSTSPTDVSDASRDKLATKDSAVVAFALKKYVTCTASTPTNDATNPASAATAVPYVRSLEIGDTVVFATYASAEGYAAMAKGRVDTMHSKDNNDMRARVVVHRVIECLLARVRPFCAPWLWCGRTKCLMMPQGFEMPLWLGTQMLGSDEMGPGVTT